MASAQVVETSVANSSPSQDSNPPDDLFQSRYVTPRLKPFSYYTFYLVSVHKPRCLSFSLPKEVLALAILWVTSASMLAELVRVMLR